MLKSTDVLGDADLPRRSYKTPSALVQQLFATYQGKLTAATRIEYPSEVDIHNQLLAASTTVSGPHCQTIVIKVGCFQFMGNCAAD